MSVAQGSSLDLPLSVIVAEQPLKRWRRPWLGALALWGRRRSRDDKGVPRVALAPAPQWGREEIGVCARQMRPDFSGCPTHGGQSRHHVIGRTVGMPECMPKAQNRSGQSSVWGGSARRLWWAGARRCACCPYPSGPMGLLAQVKIAKCITALFRHFFVSFGGLRHEFGGRSIACAGIRPVA
jgi:hypothetical protein